MEEKKPSPPSTESSGLNSPTKEDSLEPQEAKEEPKEESREIVIAPETQRLLERHAMIQNMSRDINEIITAAVETCQEKYPDEETLLMKILSGEYSRCLGERDKKSAERRKTKG